MENLYDRIELLGKQHGYENMTALCKAATVSRAVMSELKSGRTSSLSTKNATKFAKHLNVSVDYLLGNTEIPHGYVLKSEDYPELIKPFSKVNGGGMVFDLENAPGYLSPEELAELLISEMQNSTVKFDVSDRNPINEMLALLPEHLRDQKMTLFEAVKYIASNPFVMRQLQESGYNEQGELLVPTDAFDQALITKIIKDALHGNGEIRITADGQEKPATKDDELNKMKLPSNVFPIPKMRPVPVVGTIRAGLPILAEENIEGYEYDDVPEDKDYFFLRVKGDSMIGAHILDGSLVLIKPQPCADDGQIVACLVNGDEATLKRFYQQGDMVILKPENPAYNPIIVPCSDFDSGYARIVGIVIEVKFKV